jgi:3-dehydroquinate synthase
MSTIASKQLHDDTSVTDDLIVLDTFLPGDVRYYLGQDTLLSLGQQLEAYDVDRVIIVTQRLLWEPHGRQLYAALKQRYLCNYAFVPDGESAKSFSILASLCEELVELGATRDTVLVALGGGVVGNITGLAAALLYRGIRFVEVPTTTTALTDSVLSNKQAVNGRRGKNHFGVYYPPMFIWGDTRTAMSEPSRVRRAGFVESVKNGLVGTYPILNVIEQYYHSEGSRPICETGAAEIGVFG